MKRLTSRSLLQLLFLAVGIALGVVAFLRGDYLLGPLCGAVYAAIAAGIVWIVARALTAEGGPAFVRAAVVVALSVPVGFAMADPAAINPDVQVFIGKQAADRAARRELAAEFAADPTFRDLWVTSVHLKAVNVTIHGSLPGRADLDRLRIRIIKDCPAARGCILHWDVTLRETGQRVNGLDSELFRGGKPKSERRLGPATPSVQASSR